MKLNQANMDQIIIAAKQVLKAATPELWWSILLEEHLRKLLHRLLCSPERK